MATFTESQRNKYIEVTSTPEVEAKTDYKLSLLKEANEYSDLELKLKRKAIFAYLMSEKSYMLVTSMTSRNRKRTSVV